LRDRILEIEQLRKDCDLLTISKDINENIILQGRPAYPSFGLYWIYTSYSLDQLCNARKSDKEKAVDIPGLSNSRKDLKNILRPNNDDYWVVYNGIGGGHNSKYNLGSRIAAEFKGGKNTGSLQITDTNLNDLSEWRYSYVLLDPIEYKQIANELEVGWRLEFDWPILSKR